MGVSARPTEGVADTREEETFPVVPKRVHGGGNYVRLSFRPDGRRLDIRHIYNALKILCRAAGSCFLTLHRSGEAKHLLMENVDRNTLPKHFPFQVWSNEFSLVMSRRQHVPLCNLFFFFVCVWGGRFSFFVAVHRRRISECQSDRVNVICLTFFLLAVI